MTGHKRLAEVRAELEGALGAGPAGTGEVAESLRRFLAAGTKGKSTPQQKKRRPAGPKPPVTPESPAPPGR